MQNTDGFRLIGSSQDGLTSSISYWNGFTNCKICSLSLLILTMKEICCQSTMMKIYL